MNLIIDDEDSKKSTTVSPRTHSLGQPVHFMDIDVSNAIVDYHDDGKHVTSPNEEVTLQASQLSIKSTRVHDVPVGLFA